MISDIEKCAYDEFEKFINGVKKIMDRPNFHEFFLKRNLDKKGEFKGDDTIQRRCCSSSPRSSYIAVIMEFKKDGKVNVTRNIIHYNKK